MWARVDMTQEAPLKLPCSGLAFVQSWRETDQTAAPAQEIKIRISKLSTVSVLSGIVPHCPFLTRQYVVKLVRIFKAGQSMLLIVA